MPSSRIRSSLLAAFVALALPAALAAQEPAPAPFELPEQAELQGWLTELQDIHGKLEAIQLKALEDPGLAASQEALGASIRAAMEKSDPTLPQWMARVPTLEAEAQAAQQAGDQEKLQALGTEAQQIQERFQTAQQNALQQPDLAAQLQAFQQQLETRMLAVDPAAPQLISRYKELEAKLSAVLGTGE